jgi:hypothetical protein
MTVLFGLFRLFAIRFYAATEALFFQRFFPSFIVALKIPAKAASRLRDPVYNLGVES